jgi:hypothetical protein
VTEIQYFVSESGDNRHNGCVGNINNGACPPEMRRILPIERLDPLNPQKQENTQGRQHEITVIGVAAG